MNYDGLTVDEDTKLRHLIRMMENLHVPQTLRKPAGEILPFVYDIKQCMRGNPYHNFTHITDVTQYMYTLLLATHIAGRLSPIELAAANVGAMCHDLDHPGLSNTYQNNEGTDLSKKFDKESPLENHHLTVFKRLADKHRLLENLRPDEKERFLEVVNAMILATDMAKHGLLMKKIKENLAEDRWHPLESKEGINLILQIGLKCADISNQARPWKVAETARGIDESRGLRGRRRGDAARATEVRRVFSDGSASRPRRRRGSDGSASRRRRRRDSDGSTSRPPRLVSAEYLRRGRGGAATRRAEYLRVATAAAPRL